MHIKRHLLANAFCVLLLLDQTIDAKFTADFNRFLVERFGLGVAQQLERADLGDGGSFGGRAKAEQTIRQQPIVLVHGITNKIDRFSGIRQHFLDNGYTDAEIYGTTWGDAGKTGFMFVAMTCDFVKQVRNLIVAVSMYTGQHVDVIAYSMGSPISRKAILGGNCVDTLENIGPPLTLIVDTFLGVAGANHGTFLCFVPFGSCNNVNGLHCTSRFLADINSRQRYEGEFIYTIFSTSDDKVGYQACGQLASAIYGENEAFQMNGMNHDQVMDSTAALQRSLVLNHKE